MEYSTVPVEAMRDQLLTLDHIREEFEKTEPLSEVAFNLSEGAGITFGEDEFGGKSGALWHERGDTDPAPAWLELPHGERYQLTRQAVSQLASTCHITQGYQTLIPSDLLRTNMLWWLSTGLGALDLKLLAAGRGTDENGGDVPLAVAQCRETITPFSNLRLLDAALESIYGRYGEDAEVLVDYKFHHTMDRTDFRLIVPAEQRLIEGTATDLPDVWSMGIQIKNSPIGLKQTTADGYAFRWICTNGDIDVAQRRGGFERRGSGPDDVYEWARETVDEILGGLEEHLDGVQDLVRQPVEGSVQTVITDLAGQYGLPVNLRKRVLAEMAEIGGHSEVGLNMYDLMQSVTRSANLPGLEPQAVEQLMVMGGHIAHVHGARCRPEAACRRLLPPDYVAPRDVAEAQDAHAEAGAE
jgi:hypothetical protein